MPQHTQTRPERVDDMLPPFYGEVDSRQDVIASSLLSIARSLAVIERLLTDRFTYGATDAEREATR